MITNPTPTQPETLEQISKIRRRALVDGYRSLTLKDGTASLALVQARADVLEVLDILDRAAVTAPRGDGISWTALLGVLERLRSKNRNPDNEWYHGWNAAIQCLINDINSRAATLSSPAESVCAKCGGSGEIEIGRAMDHALTAPCVERHGAGTVTTTPAERTRVEGEQETK